MTPHTCRVLDGIVRTFGEAPFTTQDAADAVNQSPERMAYFLKILTSRLIITRQKCGPRSYEYFLATPMDEAIQHLREMGFTQIALVG